MSTYAKIEHGMYEHPKIVGLSDTAFRAYVESILYSGKHLTDGFLDERIVYRMWGNDVAEELCSNDPVNPSWVRVEGGWQIYGYCERQTSKAEIDALREQKRSAANARWHAKRNAQSMHGAYDVHSTSDAQAMPEVEVEVEVEVESVNAHATRLPADWVPTKAHYERAKELNVDIMREAEMFRLHAETHDRKAKKWNAAFTMWLSKAKPMSQPVRQNFFDPPVVERQPAWKTGNYGA